MWTRLRAIVSRLTFMLARRRFDEDLRIEIDTHLDSLTEHYRRQGLSPDEAFLAARRQFGNPAVLRQDIREMNSIGWLEHTVQDVRHALRQLARTPAFAGVVIVTLALGIGSTTAIFSVVEAVLLRPLAYPESDRLVRFIERTPGPANEIGYQQSLASIWSRDLPTLRAQARTLSHVGIHSAVLATVTIDPGNPLRLEGSRVSPSIFEMLGVRPVLGRIFFTAEESASAEPVVIISYSMWQQHFGGRNDVLGRSIEVGGTAATIVGVTPPAFQFPDANSLYWLPYTLGGRMQRIPPIARLADGVTIEMASANIEAILQEVRKTEPRRPGATSTSASRFEVRSIQEHLVAPVRPVLLVLAFAVAFVLLIACVNVTSLLLNRNAARRQELALRVALGASPGRIVRYVMTETLLLATCGGAAGVLLSFGTVSLLRTLGTSLARRDLTPGVSIPRLEEIGIDGTALMFGVAVTLCTGLLVGWLPVVRYGIARQTDAGPSRRGRAAILVSQTALATMALIGGGLLVHSFVKLTRVDPGYDPDHLLTFSVRPSASEGSVALSEEIAERLRVLPGVKASGYAELLPMVRFRTGGPLTPAQPMPAGTPPPPEPIDMRTVSHAFVDAMGMRIVAGRSLREDDERAVLMNETLAGSGFLGPRALGQHVLVAGNPDPFEVVGIVRDVRQYGLDQEPDPQVFVDARQLPPGNPSPYYAVRVEGNPADYVSSVREAVREIDSSAVLDNVATMQQVVSNALSRPRLFAVLAAAFAFVAALLAAIGVYGVTAYSVTQRTRELAVRLALGARPTELLVMVIRQGVAWTLVGLFLGVAGSVGLSRYLQGVLFGITPVDPLTFAVVSALFLVVALLATFIPARRIARVDPLVAFRVALFLLLIGPAVATPAQAQMPPGGGELPPIEVQKLRPNLFLVSGAHANSVVFARAKDLVLIDTKGPKPGWGRAVADEIARFTKLPITTIINTSASGNSVGGNPDFAGGKVEIIAHEYAPADMRFMKLMFPKPTGGGLPTRTFKDRLTVGAGSDRLELYYFGPTTNRSSIFVVIPALRVMLTGVAFGDKTLPALTRPSGGNGVEFPNTLTKALPLMRDVDTIITGRSGVATPRELEVHRDFMRDFLEYARQAKKAGKSPAAAAKAWRVPARYAGYKADPRLVLGSIETIYRQLP
jgi:predicted permease